MGCLINNCIDLSCDDKRKVGGVKTKIWRVNDQDLLGEPTIDSEGFITALNFDAYGGLVTLKGVKNSHSGGYTVVKSEGGNTGYTHDVAIKTLSSNPTDDATLEEWDVAEGAIIVETNNKEFFIYGLENGMESTEGSQNSGTTADSDISDIRSFQGEEQDLPKRFFITDYATTKALIESYEVCSEA